MYKLFLIILLAHLGTAFGQDQNHVQDLTPGNTGVNIVGKKKQSPNDKHYGSNTASLKCPEGYWGKYCHLKDECYYNGNKKGYLGSTANTRLGRKCMKWSLQSPHKHNFKASDFPDGDNDHNFCRSSPEVYVKGLYYTPWCYTTDPRQRWNVCDVKDCACPLGYHGLNCEDRPSQPTLSADINEPVDGGSLTLTCTTTTGGITSYQFRKNDAIVFSTETSNSYDINPVHLSSHSGNFSCVAFIGNVASTSSSNVTIQVRPKTPTLKATPSKSTVLANTQVTLECRSESKGRVTYIFMKDKNVTVHSSGSYLHLQNVNAAANLSYTCIAQIGGVNSTPSVEHKITVVDNSLIDHLLESRADHPQVYAPPTSGSPHGPVVVGVTMSLINILSSRTKTGEVVLLARFSLKWNDPSLSWDPELFGNVTSQTLPRDAIWTPDIARYYLTEPSESLAPATVRVSYDGQVINILTERMSILCFLQKDGICGKCPLALFSWTQDANALDLRADRSRIDVSRYYAGSKFSVRVTRVSRREVSQDTETRVKLEMSFSFCRKNMETVTFENPKM